MTIDRDLALREHWEACADLDTDELRKLTQSAQAMKRLRDEPDLALPVVGAVALRPTVMAAPPVVAHEPALSRTTTPLVIRIPPRGTTPPPRVVPIDAQFDVHDLDDPLDGWLISQEDIAAADAAHRARRDTDRHLRKKE